MESTTGNVNLTNNQVEEGDETLFDLIEKKKWHSVLVRLETKVGRTEASQRGGSSGQNVHPLGYACQRRDVPLSVVTALIKSFPRGIKQKSFYNGDLPIHLASRNKVSVNVIKLLLDTYLDGSRQIDQFGMLPIHYAAKHNPSSEVIQLLIKSYKKGLQHEENSNGSLPIHLAARDNISSNVMTLLIEGYSYGLQTQNKKGCLPIHLAACGNTCPSIMKLMITNFSEGLKHKNNLGELPIHVAASYNTSAIVMKLLTESYPAGLRVPNNNGALPIHRLCSFNSICTADIQKGIDMFRMMIDAYPQGIILTLKYRGTYRNVHEIATLRHLPSKLISYLLKAQEHFYISLAFSKVES